MTTYPAPDAPEAVVRDIAEQLAASIAGLGFPVGMGVSPPEEMCLRAARGIHALYGKTLAASPAVQPAAREKIADKLAKAFRANIFDHPHKRLSEESERTVDLFASVAAEALSTPAQASGEIHGEVTDEWAERFCEAVNWSPDGQECKTVEGEFRCVSFRDLAKGYILAAIATNPNEAPPPAEASESGGEGQQAFTLLEGWGDNWIVAKGKLSDDEPAYGVQLLADEEVVSQGEGDTILQAVSAAFDGDAASWGDLTTETRDALKQAALSVPQAASELFAENAKKSDPDPRVTEWGYSSTDEALTHLGTLLEDQAAFDGLAAPTNHPKERDHD